MTESIEQYSGSGTVQPEPAWTCPQCGIRFWATKALIMEHKRQHRGEAALALLPDALMMLEWLWERLPDDGTRDGLAGPAGTVMQNIRALLAEKEATHDRPEPHYPRGYLSTP